MFPSGSLNQATIVLSGNFVFPSHPVRSHRTFRRLFCGLPIDPLLPLYLPLPIQALWTVPARWCRLLRLWALSQRIKKPGSMIRPPVIPTPTDWGRTVWHSPATACRQTRWSPILSTATPPAVDSPPLAYVSSSIVKATPLGIVFIGVHPANLTGLH